MHNFRELNIWKKSLDLTKLVLNETKSFPEDEKYGLISQINRSAISIPSNIAEGSGRTTNKDFSRFSDIAKGSSYELETQLIISFEMEYLSQEKFDKLIEHLNEVQKMLRGFQKTIQ